MPKSRQIVAYVRVSTARQGRSGLGLEGQQAAIASFAKTEGYEIVATFTAHSDDCDQSFQRIATSVTRVRDGAVGCCF